MRRPAPPKEIPPPLELECLKALWRLGEGNVRDVQALMTVARPLAYTTVMTVLERLVKRDAATRKKLGRSYVYTPKLSREILRRAAIHDLLADYFDGDVDALRQFLSGASLKAQEQATSQDLDTSLL